MTMMPIGSTSTKIQNISLAHSSETGGIPGETGIRSFPITRIFAHFPLILVTFQKASALTLLRAIGARGRTLVLALLIQVVAVVTIGSLLAFGLYALALQGVSNLGVRVEVRPVLVTSLAVLVLALLTSLVAVRRVLRLDPLAATTGAGVQV